MIEKPAFMAGFLLSMRGVRTFAYTGGMSDTLERHSALKSEWPWSSFTPAEMACRHCGEGYDWPDFMQRLQAARSEVGRPFHILSAHRCGLHNARVGGAPLSQHLKLAADISLTGHDLRPLLSACRHSGFTGFGFYNTFLHIDLGRPRHWFGGQKAKDLWRIYLD